MNDTHSPLPFRVGDAGHTIFGPKREDGAIPETIATVKNPANARFLARGANNYDALMARVKDLVAVHDAQQEGTCFCGGCVSARALLAKIDAETK